MIIAYLLFLHFIADFLLQSREMGKTKSGNIVVLFQHLAINWTVIVLLLPLAGVSFQLAMAVSTLNAIVHGVIDWYIWRIYKLSVINRIRRAIKPQEFHMFRQLCLDFKYWDDHFFYVTIGADQLLHALTLITLAEILLK